MPTPFLPRACQPVALLPKGRGCRADITQAELSPVHQRRIWPERRLYQHRTEGDPLPVQRERFVGGMRGRLQLSASVSPDAYASPIR